ncbi:hypothetical protein PGO40_00890 [Klebsiella aerogenes]
MSDLLLIKNWLMDHHALSVSFGFLSAGLWIKSATAKVKTGRSTVVAITFDDPEENVDLHEFFLTARLQSKYNSYAAFAAAATVILQIAGC